MHAYLHTLSTNGSTACRNHVAVATHSHGPSPALFPGIFPLSLDAALASVSPTPASLATAGIRNHVCKGILAWFFRAFPDS